jgi:hypothetical protein
MSRHQYYPKAAGGQLDFGNGCIAVTKKRRMLAASGVLIGD